MIKNRLNLLRSELKKNGFDGYIIPSTDEYLSEYVPSYAKRLEYITGFSGSNGLAIILPQIVLFFTDGRYTSQCETELDANLFKVFDQKFFDKIQWSDYIKNTDIIAYDPKLFSLNSLNKFDYFNVRSHAENLIDKIWSDQPQRPNTPIYDYPLEFAGEDWTDKVKKCLKFIADHDASALLITDLASICWLFNIRASDVECSPLLLGQVIITIHEIYLLTNIERFNSSSISKNIHILPETEFEKILGSIDGTIIFDENQCSSYISSVINLKESKNIKNPCMLWKSCKNEVEIEVMKQVHVVDSVAICEMLSFIDSNDLRNYSEHDLGVKLSEFRARSKNYKYDSFPTICGFNENSSIIHYQANKNSSKQIIGNGLLLIDSGGQYFGGTTDVTRTIAIGKALDFYKEYYTLVLKGHIGLGRIRFPADAVCGANLDVLARQYLWQQGLDYPHGTGHGVGNFLSVHEGPQNISLNSFNQKLYCGMVLSNEPGYYVAGEFGIRIENMMYVREAKHQNFLEFETLTLVPYDITLIKFDMLSQDEITHLAHYYQQIKNIILPLLSSNAQKWLNKQMLGILNA